jgi:serine/threonine protein phosphatase PrpC
MITAAGASHRGRVRSENQDSYGQFPREPLDPPSEKGRLFIVADGMGGHKAGREASELAVETLAEAYYADPAPDAATSLQNAFLEANRRIYEQSLSSSMFAGMGTTCTALVLTNGRGVIGHIGDSRIYRVTRRKILQLTEDHSRVADLVRRAIITKEQARTHPERSQLYRALGTRDAVEVDILPSVRLPSDCYCLLCTDGLFNHVSEDEMQSIVLARAPQDACHALVDLANERGGQDNITVQVVHTVARVKGGP